MYKTRLATLHFQGRAEEWYGGVENEQPQELVELVKRRFKKCGTRSAVEEFKRLHQTGSVEDYMDQFERAKSRLLLESRHLPESFFVEAYLSGLREEIKPGLSNLTTSFELSLYMESASENQIKRFKVPVRNHTLVPNNSAKGGET